MIKISASSIKDYLKCNKLLWYRTFAKSKAEPVIYLKLGSLAHKVVEEYSNKWESVDEGLKYSEEISPDFDLDYNLVKGEMELYVNTFYDYLRNLVTEDSIVEEFFKIPLEYKDTYLVGKIDLMNLTNDTLIDWKTSKRLPYSIDNDPQFIIYNYAFKETYGRYPNQVLLGSLRTGKLIKFRNNEFYSDILFNQIIPSMVTDFKNKNFQKNGVFRGSCNTCPFALDCWSEYDELDSRKHFAQV